MITDAYNSLRDNRAVRADYLETLIESYFHGMNKDARNKAHDEFMAIILTVAVIIAFLIFLLIFIVKLPVRSE